MKKVNFLKIVAAAMVVAVVGVVSSCKYDEGPKISLASKKGRVANTWKVDKIFINGTESTCNQACQDLIGKIEYTKDGNVTWNGTDFLTGNPSTSKGTWEFNDDKTEILTTITEKDGVQIPSPTTSSIKILKLKSKELWTESTDQSGTKTESHFIPA